MKVHTRVGVAALLVSAWAAAVSAGALQDDLKARRGRVMERLGREALLIVWGDSSEENDPAAANLYYLTGTTQSDSILVLMPGNATKKEILFVRPFNARREHWDGH